MVRWRCCRCIRQRTSVKTDMNSVLALFAIVFFTKTEKLINARHFLLRPVRRGRGRSRRTPLLTEHHCRGLASLTHWHCIARLAAECAGHCQSRPIGPRAPSPGPVAAGRCRRAGCRAAAVTVTVTVTDQRGTVTVRQRPGSGPVAPNRTATISVTPQPGPPAVRAAQCPALPVC